MLNCNFLTANSVKEKEIYSSGGGVVEDWAWGGRVG